jgi:hypothetical protein
LNDGTSYTGYIMTIIADPAYLKNDLTKLNRLKYNQRDTDFTGAVLYQTPNGNFVSGWFYTDGIITGEMNAKNNSTTNAVKTGKPVTQNLKTDLVEEVCTDWYTQVTVNGVTYPPEYTSTTCVTYDNGDPGGSSGSPGSSTGSPGSSNGTGNGNSTTVTNPCSPATGISNSALTNPHKMTLTAAPGAPGAAFPPPKVRLVSEKQ